MHTHVRIYTSIIDTVLSAVCFLEGPTCWRMGWPHVAARGGPRHTRARAQTSVFHSSSAVRLLE